MRSKDFRWNKTKAQCPHCGGWYTRQGILGHIRFRHPHKSDENTFIEELERMKFADAHSRASAMLSRDGRLDTETREKIFDLMLLDYLERMAKKPT